MPAMWLAGMLQVDAMRTRRGQRTEAVYGKDVRRERVVPGLETFAANAMESIRLGRAYCNWGRSRQRRQGAYLALNPPWLERRIRG